VFDAQSHHVSTTLCLAKLGERRKIDQVANSQKHGSQIERLRISGKHVYCVKITFCVKI